MLNDQCCALVHVHFCSCLHWSAQLLACATLFWFAMVLKTIIARAVSSHFMKEAHFAKMKIALEKASSMSWRRNTTTATGICPPSQQGLCRQHDSNVCCGGPVQEAFLAALSQPRQEDRVDDVLLDK
jgi:hypothetical protein